MYSQFTEYLDSQGIRKGWLITLVPEESVSREDLFFKYGGFTINKTAIPYKRKKAVLSNENGI